MNRSWILFNSGEYPPKGNRGEKHRSVALHNCPCDLATGIRLNTHARRFHPAVKTTEAMGELHFAEGKTSSWAPPRLISFDNTLRTDDRVFSPESRHRGLRHFFRALGHPPGANPTTLIAPEGRARKRRKNPQECIASYVFLLGGINEGTTSQ